MDSEAECEFYMHKNVGKNVCKIDKLPPKLTHSAPVIFLVSKYIHLITLTGRQKHASVRLL